MDVAAGNIDLLMRLMSASTERARVLASNIANENTPGYRRKTVQFEELLGASLAAGDDLGRVEPRVAEDALTPARADGNNVTLELEINASHQNRLLYETYASILETHFDLLRVGIESGR
jgi:flagellar basal-body rod protein FlgB